MLVLTLYLFNRFFMHSNLIYCQIPRYATPSLSFNLIRCDSVSRLRHTWMKIF
jgi:hypothetical protein